MELSLSTNRTPEKKKKKTHAKYTCHTHAYALGTMRAETDHPKALEKCTVSEVALNKTYTGV